MTALLPRNKQVFVRPYYIYVLPLHRRPEYFWHMHHLFIAFSNFIIGTQAREIEMMIKGDTICGHFYCNINTVSSRKRRPFILLMDLGAIFE